MPETLIIKGGNPLIGEVTPVPNKNSILSALPACILTDETVTYQNVPRSTDVLKMLEMLRLMGAEIDDSDFDSIKISCKKLESCQVDHDLGNLIRASVMFAGPLLVRFGIAKIPVPGGCVLGKRSISAHIDAFQKAGISVEYEDGCVVFKAPQTKSSQYDIWQFEASVTATENIAMYASGTDAEFEITDCACEPHVAQLTQMLSDMGSTVSGIGSNKVSIKGKAKLSGVTYTPDPDFVDIAGFIVAAAVTKGKIRIKGANIKRIVGGLLEWFRKFNIRIEEDGCDLIVTGSSLLKIDSKNTGFPLAAEDLPKFVPRPWPGFPVDALPAVVTLACKTDGKLLIQNWMYETGLDFIKELNQMGADIFMADSQRIIINGPVHFKGGTITAPGIIQACKSIFLASLADPVETIILGADILKRRYPDIVEKYRQLGSDIQVL